MMPAPPGPTLPALLLAAACSAPHPDVIFLPSPVEVVSHILDVGRVGPADTVFDLGCGDGRVVIAAARLRDARGVCVEIDGSLIEATRRNADTAGVLGRVELRQTDMFETDLGPATVVALYLSPALNERLRPKLFREMRPGARVVSHNFPMGDWRPDTAVRVAWPSGAASVIYGWTMPADVAGSWTLEVSGDSTARRYRLRFTQRYQEVEGTASLDGRTAALGAVRLRGDSIDFQFTRPGAGPAEVLRFRGRVGGGSMAGEVTAGGRPDGRPWRARRSFTPSP